MEFVHQNCKIEYIPRYIKVKNRFSLQRVPAVILQLTRMRFTTQPKVTQEVKVAILFASKLGVRHQQSLLVGLMPPLSFSVTEHP